MTSMHKYVDNSLGSVLMAALQDSSEDDQWKLLLHDQVVPCSYFKVLYVVK